MKLRTLQSFFLSVGAGVVLFSGAASFHSYLASTMSGDPANFALAAVYQLGHQILPALVAGFLFGRRGFLIGSVVALASLITGGGTTLLSPFYMRAGLWSLLEPLAVLAQGAVCGAAGEMLRIRLLPNQPLHPDALTRAGERQRYTSMPNG